MKTSSETIDWIHSLLPFGIKPGLKRMEWMLDKLGHPEGRLKTIHVGGTNGKGSTVSFLRHALEEAGYCIGTFTSPYIETFEERISVNGVPIEEEALVNCANIIRPLVEELAESDLGSPTEFEVITTIGFLYFATIAKVDLVIVEVGLGGRLDSTNVITPLISVITSIGFDHMHILGNSLEEITSEKAGIIKENCPIVSGVSQAKARAIIREKAKQTSSPYYQLGEDFTQLLIESTEDKQVFEYQSSHKRVITLTMQGPHQRENASVAIAVLDLLKSKGFAVGERELTRGLQKTTWLGRFEKISNHPLIVLDGAHNKEGLASLANTLMQHYPDKKYRFLLAATKEKDMKVLLEPFSEMNANFTFTSFDFFRAAEAITLYDQSTIAVSQKRYHENWETAFDEEMKMLDNRTMLIVCGSLYFVSTVRKKWYSKKDMNQM